MIDRDTSGARVLFVDDDPNLLAAIERSLFDAYDVTTADGGDEALQLIGSDGPFEVIVSDMQMPKMNGAEFLTAARRIAPDSVRLLLTGQAELSAAIAAVNDGNIFRFLCKPCPSDELARALHDAALQHRLVTAERQLLEHTLKGAVEVLVDVLSIAAPSAFSRASEIKACVSHMASSLNMSEPWRFEVAAMLSHLGTIAIPTDVLDKALAGMSLTDNEQAMVDGHPQTAYGLLKKIPRLEAVAEMVRGVRDPVVHRPESDIQWGTEMLRTATDFEAAVARGKAPEAALDELEAVGRHPARLVQALRTHRTEAPDTVVKELRVAELQPGMTLRSPVNILSGSVLVPAGRELTTAMVARIQNFARSSGVEEPIAVEYNPG